MRAYPRLCERCRGVADHTTDMCCDSHRKTLCHTCYRYTHFVEVCGCQLCKARGDS